jgi:hypothetical protein
MKPQEAPSLNWVGIDLHVHTPASKDFRGSTQPTEYLSLIRRANAFGAAANTSKDKKSTGEHRNPIGCVAFTDHNSVEGFRKFRQLQEETERLSKAIRTRDPENSLVPQLEEDLEVLRSVRVLLGVEIKADPGIHVLIIFAESVEPDEVAKFLESAYQKPYTDFAGDPTPVTSCTLKETLDRIGEKFADRALVVFPHIDSNGGVFEELKAFPTARVAALTHPIVRALSFNRLETRDRLLNDVFNQPAYQRPHPLALIQSSDFHGQEGSSIGEPRTEIQVRDGKATFKNLRESFRESGRVKCSIDFVAAEYQSLTKGAHIAKFASETGQLTFKNSDYQRITESVCAMLNSTGGIVELEGTAADSTEGDPLWTAVRANLLSIISGKVVPPFEPSNFRSFQFSPGKARVLIKVPRANRLHLAFDKPFVMDAEGPRLAAPFEVESIVSQCLSNRFTGRFERTLRNVARQSTLLSKLPRGIPLLLSCQNKLYGVLPESITIVEIQPASDKGADAGELVDDLLEHESDRFPFGLPAGNTSLLAGTLGPRGRDHYHRFTIRRTDVNDSLLEKCSWGRVDDPSIVVQFSGYAGLAEPGHIISDTPAILLRVRGEWKGRERALLSWMKSSFFIWYCAAHLGTVSPFIEFQVPPVRLPLPLAEYSNFLGGLDELAQSIISAEMNFMDDINRHKKKGTLDEAYQEKVRRSHNSMCNKMSLTIDKEIYKFLSLSPKDEKFIAQTLRDINLTDFGFLEEEERDK